MSVKNSHLMDLKSQQFSVLALKCLLQKILRNKLRHAYQMICVQIVFWNGVISIFQGLYNVCHYFVFKVKIKEVII